jgi:hypothetical protein
VKNQMVTKEDVARLEVQIQGEFQDQGDNVEKYDY